MIPLFEFYETKIDETHLQREVSEFIFQQNSLINKFSYELWNVLLQETTFSNSSPVPEAI